jgi:hypothetical protein
VGGVFDVDSAFTRARRVTLIRLDGDRARYTAPIDTARVAREAGIERDVSKQLAAPWKKLGRACMVVPYTRHDGVTEGWVIPFAVQGGRTIVMGGDEAYTRDAAGGLVRIVDHSASFKFAAMAASGPVTLLSDQPLVPTVSELVMARSVALRGREVSVTTAGTVSALVSGADPNGSPFRWQHQPKSTR